MAFVLGFLIWPLSMWKYRDRVGRLDAYLAAVSGTFAIASAASCALNGGYGEMLFAACLYAFMGLACRSLARKHRIILF